MIKPITPFFLLSFYLILSIQQLDYLYPKTTFALLSPFFTNLIYNTCIRKIRGVFQLNKIPAEYNLAQDIDRFADDPHRIALRWENEHGVKKELSYLQLREESNQFANALRQAGLTKGDTLMVMLPRTPETYSVYLGALKSGIIITPGSELLQPKDLLYRTQHSKAKAVVCYHTLLDRIDEIRGQASDLQLFICVGDKQEKWTAYDDFIQSMSTDFEIVATHSSDIAFLNYTSGTTGNPKGVIHSHSWAYIHQIVAAKQWLGIKEGDVVWGTAAPGWGKWTWTPFLSALGSGATSISYLGNFNPRKYIHIINEYQVNVLCCTPTEYRMLVKLPNLDQYKLPSLRYAVSAGEALNPQVIQKFKDQFGITIRDGYGQTETTLLIATLADMEEKRGSMGKPTPENFISIIDEDGNPLPAGEVGHIAVHKDSPALFKGYLNDPERTASSFKGDWYLTGDLASMDNEGYYWYKGRADDIIISSGYTIGPAEVEDALDLHPAVQESAVVASPDEVRGFIVKAFVVLKDPKAASDSLIKELQHHVKKITASYKYPREIEFITDLPRTISNKVRRVVLRELERNRKLALN